MKSMGVASGVDRTRGTILLSHLEAPMTAARNSARLLGTGLFLAACAACAPAEPPPPPDMSAEAAVAIREADMAFAAAASSGNVDAAVAMHTADAMVFPPGQPVVSGTAAVRELWTEMSSTPGFAISWQVDGTSAASSGDLGYSWGVAQLTANGPDGAPMTSQEKYVTIWRKEADGTWKVAVDIFNANEPPPGGGN